MKMQVRHVHAGIPRTSLRRPRGKIVDICDFEYITWGSPDHRRHVATVESEGIPAILIYRMQRKGYNVILSSHLRRVLQRNSLGPANRCDKYLHTDHTQSKPAVSHMLIR